MNRSLRSLSPWVLLLLLSLLAAGQERPGERLSLLPYPQSVTKGIGFFRLSNGFRMHLAGPRDPFSQAAVSRFLTHLSERAGIRFLAPEAGSAAEALLQLEIRESTSEWPRVREDESYSLAVGPDVIRLSATNGYGLRHGLETLLQLLEVREASLGFPEAQIEDRPRFPWRGLMLDPVRHFLPVAVVKREIDAMAALKMNVLHLHLTNDQGFRVESKKFPLLQEKGGEGQFYTQEQIRDLVDYARWRGIRVVPEFGVPGHTAGWLVGYPELGSRPGPHTLVRGFGIFEPTMDPTNEKLLPFLDAFYGEMAAIFPDPYVHIGGDEITGKHWRENPHIRAFMEREKLATAEDLHAWFNRRLIPILAKHGKRVIGWDEVLHPGLPKSVTVQSWRGPESLADAARRGHEGLLSNGYYLDLMLSAASHYEPDPLGGEASTLSAEESSRILGGEACGWAEFISAENIDLKFWPRGAAAAERFWSSASLRDAGFLYARFPKLLGDLVYLGIDPRGIRERMLRRALSGTRTPADVGKLEDLLFATEFLEPVKRYYRADSGDYTTLSPLNRLVDTLWPESLTARDFLAHAREAADGRDRTKLAAVRQTFGRIARQAPELAHACRRSALLRSEGGTIEELGRTAEIGARAARALENGERVPEGWRLEAQAQLAKSREGRGEILNMLTEPAGVLLEATGVAR